MTFGPTIEDVAELTPPPGKAAIVFLRPSRYGRGRPALWTEELELIATMQPRTYAVRFEEPGRHRYMIQGPEGGHFLEADLEPGGIYFAMIYARIGWASARYSLTPIDPDSRDWHRIPEWLGIAKENIWNDRVEAWAARERPRARKVWRAYFPRWIAKRPPVLATAYDEY